jgi:hypothetical protein
MVNSLAYCAQEVLSAAREMQNPAGAETSRTGAVPFSNSDLAEAFRRNAELVREAASRAQGPGAAAYSHVADTIQQLATAAESGSLGDLELLEQRLTVLEEKMIAAAMQATSEEDLIQARADMQRQLAAYRHKMNSEQLAMLEKQYLQRQILEMARLPRLSLFYL